MVKFGKKIPNNNSIGKKKRANNTLHNAYHELLKVLEASEGSAGAELGEKDLKAVSNGGGEKRKTGMFAFSGDDSD